MPEIKIPNTYAVDLIESERGWGQKIEETKYFYTEEEARRFERDFNAQNDEDYAPDWYIFAQYGGRVK